MSNIHRKAYFICLAFLMMTTIFGCVSRQHKGPELPSALPFNEHYDYSINNAFYDRPSFTTQGARRDTLEAITEDGTFICFTTDTAQADDFINSQRTLLCFLRDSGMDIQTLRYFATDYDDSFSESSKNTAYIALTSVKTYQQVLITLQALWGDYTDYGYVYAMSNAIAAHLGWQADTFEPVEKTSMDAFYAGNPVAINLLYPSFTVEFASKETVNYSKVLSSRIFEGIELKAAIKKPIDVQLKDFYALISDYAKKIEIPFTRQSCGYAYNGKYLPLCISTTYAQLVVERNYSDYYSDMHEDYFSDYVSIYQTANIINNEITEAVEFFGLEDRVGIISINWLSSESAKAQFGKTLVNHYNPYEKKVNVTTIDGYLHEYYHHIEHLINPDLGECWQSQAFCEIGRAHSQHSLYAMEKPMTQIKQWTDLFYACTGRSYQPGVDDYYESYDILCYITNEFELDYYNGRNAINSFTHYLIDLYGEDAISNLMLFPETVCDVTGKDWNELEAEWITFLKNKFKGVKIPEWISSR